MNQHNFLPAEVARSMANSQSPIMPKLFRLFDRIKELLEEQSFSSINCGSFVGYHHGEDCDLWCTGPSNPAWNDAKRILTELGYTVEYISAFEITRISWLPLEDVSVPPAKLLRLPTE